MRQGRSTNVVVGEPSIGCRSVRPGKLSAPGRLDSSRSCLSPRMNFPLGRGTRRAASCDSMAPHQWLTPEQELLAGDYAQLLPAGGSASGHGFPKGRRFPVQQAGEQVITEAVVSAACSIGVPIMIPTGGA
jgi:hypothetical protein